MEAKLRIHLAWRVELDSYFLSINPPTVYSILPACGKQVKLLTQDTTLVDCQACRRRIE